MPRWIRPVTRVALYLRDRCACVYCGKEDWTLRGLQLDHVRPRRGKILVREGVDNGPCNLVTVCVPCNRAKADGPLSRLPTTHRLAVRNAVRRVVPRADARYVLVTLNNRG